MSIKIILADDHQTIRLAQRCILEREPDFEIVAEACNGREIIQLVEQSPPDVVIMDINMPEIDGFEATRRLSESCPGVRVIGVSLHSTEAYVLGMLHAGASGYVSKNACVKELNQAIRVVLKGQVYVSGRMHDMLITEIRQIKGQKTPIIYDSPVL